MPTRLLSALLGGLLLAFVPLVGHPAAPAARADAATDQVLALVNQVRAQHGLGPLAAQAQLQQSAQAYAQLMAATGCFSHTCGGSDFIARDQAAGYTNWQAAAENIACGQQTPQDAVTSWVNSPEHLGDMLGGYTETGIGLAYGGNCSPVWVEEFGIEFGQTPVTITTTSASSTSSSATISSTSSSTSSATSTASGPAAPSGGAYSALAPARILDTRQSGGPLGPGQSRTLPVLGQAGIPSSGVSAVVLNVTVTDTTSAGYLTVFPAGAPRPLASSLNWTAGETVPNLVEVALGAGGALTLYNAAGGADVVVDVEGWIGRAGDAGAAGRYAALTPARIFDSRQGQDSPALGPGQTRAVQVAGQGGIPATGAAAVVLNVTVTNPSAAGYLIAFPAGLARPTASNLNFVAGQTVPNRVLVPLGSGGQIDLYNAVGTTDVVIDVDGWFTASSSSGATFSGLTPTRILDTRPGSQVGAYGAPLCAGGVYTVPLAGVGGAPAGAVAAVLNVTVTDTTAGSYLTAYPDGVARPLASDLNWTPGETVPNLVVATIGTDGKVALYNAAGCADIVVDLVGYYAP